MLVYISDISQHRCRFCSNIQIHLLGVHTAAFNTRRYPLIGLDRVRSPFIDTFTYFGRETEAELELIHIVVWIDVCHCLIIQPFGCCQSRAGDPTPEGRPPTTKRSRDALVFLLVLVPASRYRGEGNPLDYFRGLSIDS